MLTFQSLLKDEPLAKRQNGHNLNIFPAQWVLFIPVFNILVNIFFNIVNRKTLLRSPYMMDR